MSTKHTPVLLPECIDALVQAPDGVYLDATGGRGGHSQALLTRLSPTGRLIILDRDPEAVSALKERFITDSRVQVFWERFSRLDNILDQCGVEQVQGICADLGVSSPQLDQAERGFSFRLDGPLDMRMNPKEGQSAANFLAEADMGEIARVLWEYGEERHARKIAKTIVRVRETTPLTRTSELAALVANCTPGHKERSKDPATRTFQGLRIFINGELQELETLLHTAAQRLTVGGRLCIISFHSLEDRMVKRFLRDFGAVRGRQDVPILNHEVQEPVFRALGKRTASAEESDRNPRARSAVLRIGEKTRETQKCVH